MRVEWKVCWENRNYGEGVEISFICLHCRCMAHMMSEWSPSRKCMRNWGKQWGQEITLSRQVVATNSCLFHVPNHFNRTHPFSLRQGQKWSVFLEKQAMHNACTSSSEANSISGSHLKRQIVLQRTQTEHLAPNGNSTACSPSRMLLAACQAFYRQLVGCLCKQNAELDGSVNHSAYFCVLLLTLDFCFLSLLHWLIWPVTKMLSGRTHVPLSLSVPTAQISSP